MKTIITIAIATVAMLGLSPKAEARPHHHSSRIYISSYLPCGTPVYRERYFAGYDHCGRAIWRTRAVRNYHRPAPRPRYVAPCPPPYRGGGHVVIHGSFYR